MESKSENKESVVEWRDKAQKLKLPYYFDLNYQNVACLPFDGKANNLTNYIN